MMQKLIAIEITLDDLQTLIIDSVNACLRHHKPQVDQPAIEADNEQLLTKKQAAKLLGVCSSTIDNHARAGNLTRKYIGKSVRFLRDEVTKLAKGKDPRQMGQSLLKRKTA